MACSYSKPQGFLEALGDVIGGAARDGARTLGDGNLINNIRSRIRNNPVLQVSPWLNSKNNDLGCISGENTPEPTEPLQGRGSSGLQVH